MKDKECKKCGRTSNVVNVSQECPFCEPQPPKQGEEKVKTLTETFIEVENDLDIEMMEEMLKIKPSALIRLKGRVAKLNFEKDTAYQKGREDVVRAVKKLREGDGKPHNDTRELHEAIVWQEGYNQALDAVLEIIRKV